MKQVISLTLIMMITQSCFPSKKKIEARIIKHFKEDYQIDVEVEKVTRALHLDWNSFQYTVHFIDEPLVSIESLYSSKDDRLLPINIGYYLTQYRFTKYLNDLNLFDQYITRAKFSVEGISAIDYQNFTIEEICIQYKSLCKLNVHCYCFDYTHKYEVEWNKLRPIIDFFKQYPEIEFSFVFAFYPSSILNTESLLTNDFGFSYNYSGSETSFEGVNLDKRIDYMECKYLSLDSLEAQWKAKLLEVEMQNNKD